jgi:hypothetical protein
VLKILGGFMPRISKLVRGWGEHTFRTVVMYDPKVSFEGHPRNSTPRSSTTGSRVQESSPTTGSSDFDPISKLANDEKTNAEPEEGIQPDTSGTGLNDRRVKVDILERWEIVSVSRMTP